MDGNLYPYVLLVGRGYHGYRGITDVGVVAVAVVAVVVAAAFTGIRSLTLS